MGAVSGSQAHSPSPSSWAVVPDRVWDGHAGRSVEGPAVVIQDGVFAGLARPGELSCDLHVERLEGCTALPGLIDAHAHVSGWMLPSFLAAGVTTVRDVGNDLDWVLRTREELRADAVVGPRLLCCGPLLDGPKVSWPRIGWRHRDSDDIAASVVTLAAAGVDAIKLYVNVTPEQMRVATRVAHEHGLPVVAHLGTAGIEEAERASVDQVEHLSGIRPTRTEVGGHPRDERTAAKIRWLCPTIGVWDRLSRMHDPVFAADHRTTWVHGEILSAWQQFPHREFDTTEILERQAGVVAMKQAVAPLVRSGSRLVAGTDTPWPWLIPGFSLHDELMLLADAGVGPVHALRAATSQAAAALARGGEFGEIRPGARADLIAVRGDPTSDLRDLSQLRMLVQGGRRIDLTSLEMESTAVRQRPADDPVDRWIIEFSARRSRQGQSARE